MLHRWPPVPDPGGGGAYPRCVALVAGTSLGGPGSASELEAVIIHRGRRLATAMSRVTGMAILRWTPGDADRVALHRAGQAATERLHREFQRLGCATNCSTRRYSIAGPQACALLAEWKHDTALPESNGTADL